MKLQNWETAKNCPKCVIMGQMQAERIVFLIRNIPIFQPEKRFVVTHLAASYAEGSEDAFYGAK